LLSEMQKVRWRMLGDQDGEDGKLLHLLHDGEACYAK